MARHTLRKCVGKNCSKSVAPKTLQELMGHASISTTMEFYAKVTEDDMQKAADAIGNLLSQSDARRKYWSLKARMSKSMGSAKLTLTNKLSKIRLRGLEPLTFGSVDRRSIQLSYRRLRFLVLVV